MKKYSNYFRTIAETKNEYEGYTIFNALIWQNSKLEFDGVAKNYNFAVIWDDDFDCRIMALIETFYIKGFLPSVIMFEEHKGSVTAVLNPFYVNKSTNDDLIMIQRNIESMSDDGDPWTAQVQTVFENMTESKTGIIKLACKGLSLNQHFLEPIEYYDRAAIK